MLKVNPNIMVIAVGIGIDLTGKVGIAAQLPFYWKIVRSTQTRESIDANLKRVDLSWKHDRATRIDIVTANYCCGRLFREGIT